jgi:rare lipoprotein A
MRHSVKLFVSALPTFVLLCISPASTEPMRTSSYAAVSPDDAAHSTLKVGTRIRVTNPQNGKSVELKIAGTGPFIEGRQLDISETAAKFLGFGDSGVLILEVEVLH